MNRRLIFYLITFTIFASSLIVILNPNLAVPMKDTDRETFLPENGHFDFSEFSIDSKVDNFTSKSITKGHWQCIDVTSNFTINVVNLDEMYPYRKISMETFFTNELQKPSFTVDGGCVLYITFTFYDDLYDSYYKNSATDMIIYIAMPDEKEIADIMNSLMFTDVE